MSPTPRNLPHLYLQGGGEREEFTSPNIPVSPRPPERDREVHAAALERDLRAAIGAAQEALAARETGPEAGTPGFYLEFDIPAIDEEVLKRLENRQRKIELVTVREADELGGLPTATVFVPERQAGFFLDRVETYRTEETGTGRPKHERLVARLEGARGALVRSIFGDRSNRLPPPGVRIWWEVWLRAGRRAHFDAAARHFEIRIKDHALIFPEREVVLALSDIESLARIMVNSDSIAELRIAKDQPSVFLDMGAGEQVDWGRDFTNRLVPPDTNHN